jgi:DNA-binding GntR family transcriptional regulator
LRAAADAGDVDGYFWANVAFHSESTRISADSTLGKTLDGLGLQVLRLRRLGMSLPGRMQRSVHDHERLLLAYRERDEDLAAVLSSSIILRALDALRGSSHMKLGEPAGAHSTMTGV